MAKRIAILFFAAILSADALRGSAAASELEASPAFLVVPGLPAGERRIEREAACAFGGGVYLVAWAAGPRQPEGAACDIRCARIEPGSGRSLDPAGLLVCGAPDLQERPCVASDGKDFLVVWQDLRGGEDYDVWAARVSSAGEVLDPGGFPVVRRASNQARPAVAFAGGSYLVVWMDARVYPTYGVYGARVAPDGRVLDREGVPLDIEDPRKIAAAIPQSGRWLGDRNYWWQPLRSRFLPSLASDGSRCLLTCLLDVHSNDTAIRARVLDPNDLSADSSVVEIPGEPRGRVASFSVPDGWIVAFDHWLGGWTPAPRLAALRLDPALRPIDSIPLRQEDEKKFDRAPLLDLQAKLAPEGSDYHQGKGHFAFWNAAVAWDGFQVIVATDFGWRKGPGAGEIHHAVVASRFDREIGRFVDERPLVLASSEDGVLASARRPAIAAGPRGECLVVWEADRGVDRLAIEGRILRSR